MITRMQHKCFCILGNLPGNKAQRSEVYVLWTRDPRTLSLCQYTRYWGTSSQSAEATADLCEHLRARTVHFFMNDTASSDETLFLAQKLFLA